MKRLADLAAAALFAATPMARAEVTEITVAYFLEWPLPFEKAKVEGAFDAALGVMAIAARTGVTGVRLSKVHAAYSLGASRAQVLWCWGSS